MEAQLEPWARAARPARTGDRCRRPRPARGGDTGRRQLSFGPCGCQAEATSTWAKMGSERVDARTDPRLLDQLGQGVLELLVLAVGVAGLEALADQPDDA